jgi:hypothetical protein
MLVKEFGLEVNGEKTHYMFMLHHQNEKKTIAYRYRPLGLQEVEAHTSSDICLTASGKVVSPMHQLLVLISVRG